MNDLLLALINGKENGLGDGALISVLAILLVFSILAIIIVITYVIGKAIEKNSPKNTETKKETAITSAPQQTNKVAVDLNDEDAVVAMLVASIDYREKTKKDFKVISVKEIR